MFHYVEDLRAMKSGINPSGLLFAPRNKAKEQTGTKNWATAAALAKTKIEAAEKEGFGFKEGSGGNNAIALKAYGFTNGDPGEGVLIEKMEAFYDALATPEGNTGPDGCGLYKLTFFNDKGEEVKESRLRGWMDVSVTDDGGNADTVPVRINIPSTDWLEDRPENGAVEGRFRENPQNAWFAPNP